MRAVVHGDDFTVLGRESDLRWYKKKMMERFDIKDRGMVGPDDGDRQSIKILNRVKVLLNVDAYTCIASLVASKAPLLGSLGLLLLLRVLLLLLLLDESRLWPVKSSGSFLTAAATAESNGEEVTIVVTGIADDGWLLLNKVVISICGL